MSETTLTVETRENTGSGAARAARREGKVPAVIYGGKGGSVAVSLHLNELKKGLNRGGLMSGVIDLDLDGKKQPALIRDIQFHPVTSVPLHVDLFRVSKDQEVEVEVPVHFINEDTSPGLKRGGALNIVRHAVELSCLPDKIPAELVVDLAEAEIGDAIHFSAIALPDGVKPTITDRDFTIATIVGKGGKADADDAEADGEEEGGDGAES